MTRTRRFGWILVGLAALALAFAGLGMAGSGEDRREVRNVKVKIVHEEDGNEETIEYEGNGPLPFLGVRTEGAEDGVLIESVVEGSGAERGGLKSGDVIVSFDGKPVEDSLDLTRGIFTKRPGDPVGVEVLRDGRRKTLQVEIGEHPVGDELAELGDLDIDIDLDLSHLDGQLEQLGEQLGRLDFGADFPFFRGRAAWHGDRPRLGVLLVEPTPELRTHLGAPEDAGVLVSRVLEGMPAELAGVRVGDVITHAGGEPIEDAEDLRAALREAEGGTLHLDLVRDGDRISLDVTLPAPEEQEKPIGRRA